MKLERLIQQQPNEGSIRVVVIPDTPSDARYGTVHMISDYTEQLREGDRIVFGKYSGGDLAIHGERCYLIMRLSDIYGVINESEVEGLIKTLKNG